MANIYDVNAALDKPDGFAAFQQGRQAAQQNQVFGQKQAAYQDALARQQQVQNLAPKVIAGDPQATEQAQAIDPQAASQYQDAAAQHIRRIQGAISYIDSQKDPQAKEAAYQQVRPYLAQFGQEPPATFAEAAPKMEAARAQIAALGTQQKNDLINVGAGGAVFDPKTRQLVYQNPGVAKTPGIVSVNLPDGSTQQYQQNPDGSLAPLRLAGQGGAVAPQGPQGTQAAPQPNVQLTPNPNAQSIAADQATALVSSGADPGRAAAQAMAMHPGTTLAFDQASGRFRDVSDGSEKFAQQGSGNSPQSPQTTAPINSGSNVLGGDLGRSAPKGKDDLIQQRQKQIKSLQGAGIQMTPDQQKSYLMTGKASPDEAPLSGEQETIAQKLANYSLPISSRFIQTAANQRLIARAVELNPDLNVGQYVQNQKLLTDLASNSPTSAGGGLAAAGTGLGHLTDLANISERLPSHDYTALNAAQNYVLGGTRSDTGAALKDWNQAKQLVAGEIAKMVKGGVASEAETKGLMDGLDPNNPNRDEAIATLGKFMIDKVKAYEAKRDKILQAQSPQTSFLNAREQDQARRIIGLSKNYEIPDFEAPGGLGYKSTHPAPAQSAKQATQAPQTVNVDHLLSKYGVQ